MFICVIDTNGLDNLVPHHGDRKLLSSHLIEIIKYSLPKEVWMSLPCEAIDVFNVPLWS